MQIVRSLSVASAERQKHAVDVGTTGITWVLPQRSFVMNVGWSAVEIDTLPEISLSAHVVDNDQLHLGLSFMVPSRWMLA